MNNLNVKKLAMNQLYISCGEQCCVSTLASSSNGLFLVFPHPNQSTGSILGTPTAQSIVRFNFNFPT